MITQTNLDMFLAKAQDKVRTDYLAFMPQHPEWTPKLSLMKGPRYARIVTTSHGDQRSSFGFIDMTNGDVLKAAGWKAPAKNFARGNVLDEHNGTGRIRWTGVY